VESPACILTLKPAMQQAGLMTGTCTGASRSVMECICASKDSGKTTSPTGHWEVQTYSSQGVALVPHLLAGIMDGCQV